MTLRRRYRPGCGSVNAVAARWQPPSLAATGQAVDGGLKTTDLEYPVAHYRGRVRAALMEAFQ